MFYLKLALSGVKTRLKEHLVLLFGLMMSSAIFYMFQTLAQNKTFLTANSAISVISLIFQIGSVLLGIITFFYVFYANSFLLSLKQKEFGLFQLLGIRKRTTATLIFCETFVLGMGSILIGLLCGTALSFIVSRLLIQQLDLTITHYSLFLPAAALLTVLFYALLFLLAALNNAWKINRVPILKLLNGEKQTQTLPKLRWFHLVFALLALLMNALGYFFLFHIQAFLVAGIFAAMLLIVLGTYLFYATTFPFLLALLRKWPGNYRRGLSLFTLGQLQFRVKEFSRTLATITILLALSLGAITVGFSFHASIEETAQQTMYYDLTLSNPTAQQKKLIRQLKETTIVQLPYIQSGTTLHYNLADFQKKTFYSKLYTEKTAHKIVGPYTAGDFTKQAFSQQSLDFEESLGGSQTTTVQFETPAAYAQLKGQNGIRYLIKTQDFFGQLTTFKALTSKAALDATSDTQQSSSRYAIYAMQKQFLSGLTFMGFFLGIAFLVILASLFMFKILTGIEPDKRRYEILHSLGVERKQMRRSIQKEIGFLFGISAIVGVLHVLGGLQMFSLFFPNPYQHLGWPFLLFSLIYFLYYGITTYMYTYFVLPPRREKA